ncbi:hypothetical protein TanjilG_01789 [Lupinus angustifolius]|uniref:Uncharacterized protein n=1 Tax=Lupinus angustifolius TaxID=3871 RepID=A0A1J7HIA9_LUPAN|nr:hypothetical protein TanjilG_01789 [Lupinus angustifolius]
MGCYSVSLNFTIQECFPIIDRLNEALEKKKKEISEFETKYKIKIRKADAEVKDESGKKEGSAQGVLVGPASGSE